MSAGTIRAAASSVIRACGPEVETARDAGASGRPPRSSDADFLLGLVDGVSLLADHFEVASSRSGSVMVVAVYAACVPLQQRARLFRRKLASRALPTAVQCGRTRRPGSVNIRIE